jgi:methionyl-tRNA formyltransferase
MPSSSKLIFFGNERLATGVETEAPTLKALVEAGYDIVAVVSNQSQAQSRQARELEIASVAHAYHIPVLLPEKIVDIKRKLINYHAHAAVLVAYGKIIPQEIIDIFPKGIINIHPSLLPEYRGPTPIEQAILDGKSHTGVSLMKLAKEMDAGPVFAQEKVSLSGNETKQELADTLLNKGRELLLANLVAILSDSLKPVEQNSSKASYTQLIEKLDGIMDFSKPAEVLEREVRAYVGWPKSRAQIFGHECVLTKARVAKNENDGDLLIECFGSYLEIQELIAPSGRKMSGADFIRGYNN